MRVGLCFVACLVLAALVSSWLLPVVVSVPEEREVKAIPSRPLVLTGHLATHTLAAALAEGTTIEVAWAWPPGAVWADQREVKVTPRAALAAAVVTLRHATAGDWLYGAVRALNFAVVEIDATVGADRSTTVLRQSAVSSGALAPAAPLSLINAARMAEVIAQDFGQLSHGDQEKIAENLRRVKERLFRLRAATEARLVEFEELEVALGSPAFAELAADFGLPVVPLDYSLPQVVLVPIGVASDPGSRHAALDPLNGAPSAARNYFLLMERNLDALIATLAKRPL